MDDHHVYELFDVKGHLLGGTRCLILCGNEEMYLMAYARAMVCMHFGLDETPGTEEACAGVFSSSWHYEASMGEGGAEGIKSILKNGNISGRRRVFIVRGVAGSPAQGQLRHLVDRHDATFVLVCKTLGNVDPALVSRAMVLRLPFDRERLSKFLERYGVEAPGPGGSVVCAVAKVGRLRHKEELLGLLGAMEAGTAKVASVRDYCYRALRRHVPLAVMGRTIVGALSGHPRACEVVSACADAESDGRLTNRGILNYEQMLVGVWDVLQKKPQ